MLCFLHTEHYCFISYIMVGFMNVQYIYEMQGAMQFTLFHSMQTGSHNWECFTTYCEWCWECNATVSTFFPCHLLLSNGHKFPLRSYNRVYVKWCTGNLMLQIHNLCIYIYIRITPPRWHIWWRYFNSCKLLSCIFIQHDFK
jgi:hypothetical protein